MAARRRYSAEEVRLIRAAYAERERLLKEADELKISKLAKKFGTSYSTMWDIVNYATYIDV